MQIDIDIDIDINVDFRPICTIEILDARTCHKPFTVFQVY